MIHIVHRGMGGRYTSYIQESVRKIARKRPITISSSAPTKPGYRVAVSGVGGALTPAALRAMLGRQTVTFYFGDSRGIPDDVVAAADAVVSVSSLPIPHQIEAAILAEEIERAVFEPPTESGT
jgi:hypothetical protein